MATWQGQSGINYEYEVRNIPHEPVPENPCTTRKEW